MKYNRSLSLPCLLSFLISGYASAAITDFGNWTSVADPVDPNFAGSANSSTITLTASTGAVSSGTDIGYQSVNGLTPASSSGGYVFSPAADFSIAIDYAWTFSGSPTGFLGLGFGIGEDGGGENSAGALMVTASGAPFLSYGGAARVNDVNEPAASYGGFSALSGSLFVAYEASSGDVTVGASTSPGAASPASTATFDILQTKWNGTDLLASVFIRSVEETSGWLGGGTAQAEFTNFRILEGAAIAVPEPASIAWMLGLVGLSFSVTRRSRVCLA